MTSDFISQRSFEIAFAVFRVAALVHQERIRAELENAAIDLYLDDPALKSVARLERLVRLGEAIGGIKRINAAVLYRELGNLETAILRQAHDEIEPIFSKPPMVTVQPVHREVETNHENGSGNGNGNGNGINSAIRQSKLIEYIRQSGNPPAGGGRMKDLIAEFPDVSERTLRYDLQRLCEQGLIERIGNGGPGSYYRALIQEQAVG